MLAAARHRVVVDLDADDGVAVAGEHLRDAGTHGAQSDNADGLEVTCHAAHPATGLGGRLCVRSRRCRGLRFPRAPGETASGGLKHRPPVNCPQPGPTVQLHHRAHLVGAAPADASRRRHPGRSSARPDPPPRAARPGAPGAARRGGRRRGRRASSGTSRVARVEDLGRPSPGDGVRLQSPVLVGAADHDGVAARDDVRRSGRVEPPPVERRRPRPAPPGRAPGARRGRPASRREPSPAQLTTTSSVCGQRAPRLIRVSVPPSSSSRATQPAQVDRHVDRPGR